jgi:hypothetical protein
MSALFTQEQIRPAAQMTAARDRELILVKKSGARERDLI